MTRVSFVYLVRSPESLNNFLAVDIKKGDSGSWVVDTSDTVHCRVIGSAIATSHGAAHFVRITDQFSEISATIANFGPISLISPFRALVNCANLAFLSDDRRADNFIDEALSPDVLKQFTKEWYISGLKSVLSDKKYSAPSEKEVIYYTGHSNAARRLAIKSLLLRYGVELLDSLIDPADFITRHGSEFSTPQWQALTSIQDALQRLRTEETERPKRVRVVDPSQSRTSATKRTSKPILISYNNLPFWTSNRLLFFQLRLHMYHTLLGKICWQETGLWIRVRIGINYKNKQKDFCLGFHCLPSILASR